MLVELEEETAKVGLRINVQKFKVVYKQKQDPYITPDVRKN